jgi:hypothetical protein
MEKPFQPEAIEALGFTLLAEATVVASSNQEKT